MMVNTGTNDQDDGIVILLMLSPMILSLICGDIHPNPGLLQNKFTNCFINMRGLRSNWESFELSLLASRPHIFCASETFLKSKIDDELFTVPGYSFLRRDRPDDSSWDGIMVYFSDTFTATRMPQYESLQHEMICLKLSLPGRMVFMFCVYRPPFADDSIYDVISA